MLTLKTNLGAGENPALLINIESVEASANVAGSIRDRQDPHHGNLCQATIGIAAGFHNFGFGNAMIFRCFRSIDPSVVVGRWLQILTWINMDYFCFTSMKPRHRQLTQGPELVRNCIESRALEAIISHPIVAPDKRHFPNHGHRMASAQGQLAAV